MTGDRGVRAPLAYRVLLRLLPAALRREFGDEMQEVMTLRLREARTARDRSLAWWHGVRDIVSVAAAERFGRWPKRRSAPPRRAERRHATAFSGVGFDVRYAMRTLLRAPIYTLATVVTLGVGIGTVTALFTVVNGVLLRPLPYRDADRLAWINSPLLTGDNVDAWLAELRGITDASAVFTIDRGTAVTPDGAVQVSVVPLGRGMLDLIGWQPSEGRGFAESDHAAGAAPVVLVSERFWQQRFGATPVAGRTLRIDDRVYEVIGVLPHDALLRYRSVDVWVPYETAEQGSGMLLARLAAGTSVDAARERLQPFADRLVTPEFTRRYEGMRVTTLNVNSIDDSLRGDVRSTLWLLLAASGVVMLLSSLNVANLAIGRTQGRSGELALRAALGAGRLRLVRQVTVEAMLIAAGSIALGLLLGLFTPALLALAPDYLPRSGDIRLDGRVLACAIAVTLGAVLVFGVVPAWWVAARSERSSLHAAVERTRPRQLVQNALVVVEIAMALVLVVGVGLLAQTYAALRPASPGFAMDDRVVASFSLPRPGYADPAATHRFASDLLASVQRSSGTRAAVTTDLPLTGMSAYVQATRETPAGDATGVHFRAVSVGYIELMEMRLVAGRSLTPADGRSDVVPIVVNETAARRLWETTDRALGRRTTLDLLDGAVTAEVVGVLEDAWVLRGPTPAPEVFAPFDRLPSGRFRLVLVSTRDRPVSERDVMAVVRDIDPGVPLLQFATMHELAAWSTVVPRFQATLLGIISAIALLLAATGCFAVLSQMVGRRTRELGIRIALGAQSASIIRLVLGRVAVLAAIGLLAGTAAALASSRFLESELYGITPSDPSTYVSAAAVMCITVLLAAARPLARALRIDPMRSLRDGAD